MLEESDQLDVPLPFAAYDLIVEDTTYTVLEAQQPDAYRVRTPDGQVIGLACLDSAATLDETMLASLLVAPQIPTPPIPVDVTQRQIRLQLLTMGVTDTMVRAAIGDNQAALIQWEFASVVRRDHPLVEQLAATLGLDKTQADDVFCAASLL